MPSGLSCCAHKKAAILAGVSRRRLYVAYYSVFVLFELRGIFAVCFPCWAYLRRMPRVDRNLKMHSPISPARMPIRPRSEVASLRNACRKARGRQYKTQYRGR
jgi:hypothetical protein